MSAMADLAAEDLAFREAVLTHLAAIQRCLELLTAPPAEEVESETCPHLPEHRLDMSGMGTEEWMCRACGAHVRYSLRKG